MIYVGTEIPSVNTGVDNDIYIQSTGDLWLKINGEWVKQFSIKGEQGVAGVAGINGINGQDGINGADGINGTDGEGVNNSLLYLNGLSIILVLILCLILSIKINKMQKIIDNTELRLDLLHNNIERLKRSISH